MNKIRFIILKFLLETFWKSKRGIALTHLAFDKYKNSILFEERLKHFGSFEAAKMLSYNEYKHFINKVRSNKKTMFTIFIRPDTILNKYLSKDEHLKKCVKFES